MTKNTCYLTTRWLISGFIHKYPLLATNTKVNSCFIIHSNSKIIKHIKMTLTYYSFKTIYSCNTIKCSCPNPMHLMPRWTAHDIWNLNSKSDCTFKAIHCFSIYLKKLLQLFPTLKLYSYKEKYKQWHHQKFPSHFSYWQKSWKLTPAASTLPQGSTVQTLKYFPLPSLCSALLKCIAVSRTRDEASSKRKAVTGEYTAICWTDQNNHDKSERIVPNMCSKLTQLERLGINLQTH